MASRTISVEMQSHYTSDLSKELRRDKQKLDEFQKYLNKRGFTIPVRLDLKNFQSQAGEMRKIVQGAFANMPSPIVGADGRPMASGTSSGKAKSGPGLLARTSTTTYNKKGDVSGKYVSELEQIGAGLQRVSRYKKDVVTGSPSLLSSATKDISNVNDLREALRGMGATLRETYGFARGRGDKDGQITALREHQDRLNNALASAKANGLENSPHYISANSQIDRVSERIASLQGGNQSAAERAAAAAKSKAEKIAAAADRRRFDNKLRREEERVDLAQKANAQDIVRANSIQDLTHREAELNRLYAERKKIFTDSQSRFQGVDASRQGRGDSAGSDKAMRRGLNMAGHAAQVDVEETRAAAALASHRSAERKAQDAQAHTDRVAAFNREMQDIKANSEKRIAHINATERVEKAAAKNATAKQAAAEKGHLARQAEYGARSAQYGGVESRARTGGHAPVADSARGQRLRSEVTAEKDLARFNATATAGGHALDFHSSSLLRNAATYASWMIPVQAVMGMTSAFMAGVDGAIKVNHQFAVLQAVFQGTSEEAQKLKVGTLDLATSQGRSADEAMDAAIRWSRLGLSRVGVLEAVKVSLMAANVAEISSAEAAEKLSSIYATFRLNVGDLAGVLNGLNSISNNYNVTVDDMFEGISRVGGIAKQSGLELMDLAGMIGSVVGATGRSGAEAGNAIKFVVTRLAAPDAMKGLKEHFNYDMSKPNGDLKDMSLIIRELADLFPTLNNAEKQTFLSLTAGARQASRFAIALDQYRQGQALSAQAMNDSGVTSAENQLILESLEARIKSVKSSWVELFTALGDTGAFDQVGAALSGMTETLLWWGRAIEWVEAQGGPDDKGMLKRFAIAQQHRVGANFGNPFGIAKDMLVDGYHGKILGDPLKDAQQTPANAVTAMAASTTEKRNRMKQMDTFRANMDSYSKEVAMGKMEPEKRYRDFESTARGIQNLPDGSKLYAEAVADYQKLARRDDNDGISRLAKHTSEAFQRDYLKTKKAYEVEKPAAISGLEKTIADNSTKRQDLVKQLGTAPNGDKLKIVGQIKELDQVSASAAREIAALKDEIKGLMDSAFSPKENAAIDKFLNDMVGSVGDKAKDISETLAGAFGDAFKDLAPDADNDPVERIFTRRKAAAQIALHWLQQVRLVTAFQSGSRAGAASDEIERIKKSKIYAVNEEARDNAIAVQQRIIDRADDLNERLKTRIKLEEKVTQEKLDELAIAEQAAALARVQTDASKVAADSSLAWRFGETDSDKNANQAAMALARANETMAKAKAGFVQGFGEGDTPASRAANAGSVLEDEVTARKDLASMQTRNYEIEAARKQVAFDTVKAMREQTDESNKRLMLASREDQLRVAAMQQTINRSGGVSSAQFYGLSQESRQAMVNYLPNEAPGRLNPAKEARYKALNDLDSEQPRLRSAIAATQQGLDALAPAIQKAIDTGGVLNSTPDTPDARLNSRAEDATAATRDTSPQVSVNVGNVDLRVQISEQVEKILSGYVDRKLAADLGAMEARLARTQAPNAQGISE